MATNPISEQQVLYKQNLERKLEEENEELSILIRSTTRTKELTDKMQSILIAFDMRLGRLEDSVLPIHKSTQKLARLTNNIDKALSKIQAYTSVFDTIGQNERVITKGPQDCDLDMYLNAIFKLKECLQLLETTKYRASDKTGQSLKDTLWKGIRQVDDMFVKQLATASDALDPNEYGLSDETTLFPPNVLTSLQRLSTALAESLVDIGPISSFIKGYEEVRSAYLLKCLSQTNQTAKDQELKNIHSKAQKNSLLTSYLTQLIQVIKAEQELHVKIIPKHHAIQVFVNTITPVIDGFLEVCDSMLNRIKKNLGKKDTNDVYYLFEFWEKTNALLKTHSALVAYAGKKGHDLTLVITQSSGIILGYLKDLFDEFMVDDMKRMANLSADGTVHETTSTTMNTLKRLLDYKDILDIIISEKSKPFPVSSVQEYMHKMLELLQNDIDVKGKAYKKPILTNLFLLNNFHYISKSVKGTKLAENVSVEDIDKAIKKQLDIYRSSWVPVVEHLMDTTKISDQGRIVTALTAKQKEAIKEKFKNFNRDFDELYSAQRMLSIPDNDLRALVIKEIKQIVVPMYNRFYDRYTEIEFSKNSEKYIKYDKDQLVAALDQFFDTA